MEKLPGAVVKVVRICVWDELNRPGFPGEFCLSSLGLPLSLVMLMERVLCFARRAAAGGFVMPFLLHRVAIARPSPILAKAGVGAAQGVGISRNDHAIKLTGTASLHHSAEPIGNVKSLLHRSIIGMDLPRDLFGILCSPNGNRTRLPNTDKGRAQSARFAAARQASACFKAMGGQVAALRDLGQSWNRNGATSADQDARAMEWTLLSAAAQCSIVADGPCHTEAKPSDMGKNGMIGVGFGNLSM